MTLNCLVTGFDAFTGESFNPSEIIARSLPQAIEISSRKIEVTIKSLVLPTCGYAAWHRLEPVLKKMVDIGLPSVIVLLGLAGKKSTICLERFALNIRDYETPDNQGHFFTGETIDLEEPAALRTNAPLENLLKHLHSKNYSAVISNHCGTFVCNEIYFRTLQYFGKLHSNSLVSFVHLPLPENYGKALSEAQSKEVIKNTARETVSEAAEDKESQMAAMQSAVREIVEYYLNFVLQK